MEAVILDSSPLVAYFDADEVHHEWCRRQFSALRPPLLSCEPAVTEAAYLISSHGGDGGRVLEFLRDGVIKVSFDLEAEAEAVRSLMCRYASVPMDLADACLVRMTEQQREVRVFTLDGDFRIYRRHGRKVIPLLHPD